MIGFYSLLVAIGVAFSGFLITSFNSVSDFQTKTSQLVNYETTSLAASNRIAKESGEFLTQLKTSLNDAEEDCHKQSPVESLDELISDLDHHTNNQLSKTLSYGLKGKQEYKIELVHSGYIPPKIKDDDKKYASTIITPQGKNEGCTIKPTGDLSRFLQDEKLLVSEELLSDLFTEKKVLEIMAKQDELGIKTSQEGMKIQDLPNGLRLFFKRSAIDPSVISSEARDPVDQAQYLTRTAIAQLKLGEVNEELTPDEDPENPIVVDPPTVDPPVTPPVIPDEITVNTLDVALTVVPFSERGFLYNPGAEIDSSNPLQIINKKEGGYTEIFKRDDGYLQISIGTIATKLAANAPIIDHFDTAELTFEPATLQFEEVVSVKEGNSSNLPPEVIVDQATSLELDVAPRGRTTYTVADQEFEVNGVTVPKGSVIVAVRKAGIFERSPELKDFEHFRVYDPNTGAHITHFGENARDAIVCPGGTKNCMDVKKFKQEKETTSHGQDIFFSFSLQDLMPNESPLEAAKNWSNIQKDLELKLQADLNAGKADWLKDELKELNKDLDTYTGNDKIDSLTINDTEEIQDLLDKYKKGGLDAFKEALGISEVQAYRDRTEYTLEEVNEVNILELDKNNNLALFALNKLDSFVLQNSPEEISKKELQSKKDEVKNAKADFIKALDKYNQARKTAESSPNTLNVPELEDLLSDTKLPSELRSKYQSELDRIKAQEAENKKQQELAKERNTINTKITNFTNEKKKLEADLVNLEADKAELKRQKTELENTPKKDVKNKGKKLDNLKDDIKDINNKIDKKNKAIKDLDKKIANQRDKLDKLG